MPDQPEGFNLKVPIAGSLSVTGRDVVLVAFLAAMGVGLIGMQWYTFQSFTRELAINFRLLAEQIDKGQRQRDDRLDKAQADRDQILSLLRLRICVDLAAQQPKKSPALEALWQRVCT